MLKPVRDRIGREIAFSLKPADDASFGHRLVLSGSPKGCWIVLGYRTEAVARSPRPMVRFVRRDGLTQDFVLPGVALDAASWLGMLPNDLTEIRLALPLGLILERVGLRRHVDLLAQCLAERPSRFVPALFNAVRSDERRFRDILRGACAVTPMSGYPAWRAARVRPRPSVRPGSAPAIRLILPAGRADEAGLDRTIESLLAQAHPGWTLVVARIGNDPASPAVVDSRITAMPWDDDAPVSMLLAGADAIGFLRPGDILHPDALTILGDRLAEPDAPDLVHADEEVEKAILQPRLKPDWSPDLALVSGYLGRPTLLARALVEGLKLSALGSPDGIAIELAAISAAKRVVHLPRILCRTEDRPVSAAVRALALNRHLTAVGSSAQADVIAGVLDLHWPLPEPAPLVSVVIPTRDRVDLIGEVSEGLLQRTDYPAIQLVVVDNGSTDPDVMRLYGNLRADPRVRILAYPHPFNFSTMVNVGARAATGRVLLLLNNDVAVLDSGWLRALVAQAVRPEVGAVGAKLLYANGTLQHAGVVVGLGGRAGHILRRRRGDTPGHLDRMCVAHEVSAVTAACLAVERRKFEAVGGFDEDTFAVDFNDVDFCLRLGMAGWKTIWTPRAVLSHLESVSRGPTTGPSRARFDREADAFAARWRSVIRHDPFYHPGLSLTTFGEDLE